MKKLDILRICLWAFAFSIVALCYSCGSVKKDSSKKEEISKQDYSGFFRNSGNTEELFKSINYSSNLTLNKVNDQSEKVSTKKTIKPHNPKLPASYIDSNGKKYELNNATVTEETIVEKTNKQTENSGNSQNSQNSEWKRKKSFDSIQKIKMENEQKRIAEALKLDREEWQFPFWIWLIIAAIISLVLAFLNKRFGWVKYVTAFVSGLFQIRKK